MRAVIDTTADGFELRFDDVARVLCDDLTLTAWGERHALALGGLAPGTVERVSSHDELGPHEQVAFPFVTRSVRNPVAFRLIARCYELAPVALLELLPSLTQPVFGTEEAGSLRLAALPGCRRAVYLHQRVNEYGRDAVGAWWAQAAFGPDPTVDNPWDWGLATAWECADGACLALLPTRAGGAVSRLRGEGQGLSVVASGWCGRHAYPRLPLCLVAQGDSPADAIDRAFAAAAAVSEWSFRLREEKRWPEPFDQLGYATWPSLGASLSADGVLAAVAGLRRAGAPVRWLWLDEGWQHVDPGQRLVSFDAGARFPEGLLNTVRRLQGEGLRHVGVWLTLQGGWGGVAPGGPAGRDSARLFRGTDGSLVPEPGPAGADWWRDGLTALRNAGVDLLKVDNQGSTRNLYLGQLPLDQAVGGALRNLETAASEAGLELVAGMAHHGECLYHYHQTNVMRVSADVVPDDRRAAKLHLVHSAHVGAWLSRLAWPDCDAVPSTHVAARALAVVACLSGGPVYLGDAPGRHDPDLIARLSLADGRLLQPEVPAEPPACRWFSDPLAPGGLLVVAAPAGRVPRGEPDVGLNDWRQAPQATLVGLLNATLDGGPVTSDLRLDELDLVGAERYALVGHFRGEPWTAGPDEVIALPLAELEAELVTVAPILAGGAVLGLTGKLLGACGCTWDIDDVVSVPEPGEVLLYDEAGREPQTMDYEPYRLVESERPLGPGEARREGPWLWLHATSTVFRLERPR